MLNLNLITYKFNFKQKLTDQTDNDGTKDIEIMIPLKYLSNFWRTPEMPLINCEVDLFFYLVNKLYYSR